MKIILITALSILASFHIDTSKTSLYLLQKNIPQETIKTSAYNTLTRKCTICHARKKRLHNFTLENMDSLAPLIQQQVFIKKKMPKGRKIKLTDAEYQSLKDWLALVLKE